MQLNFVIYCIITKTVFSLTNFKAHHVKKLAIDFITLELDRPDNYPLGRLLIPVDNYGHK